MSKSSGVVEFTQKSEKVDLTPLLEYSFKANGTAAPTELGTELYRIARRLSTQADLSDMPKNDIHDMFSTLFDLAEIFSNCKVIKE